MCGVNSSNPITETNLVVPHCTSDRVYPTAKGYRHIAPIIAESLLGAIELDGTCRGRARCDPEETRKWRRFVASTTT